MTGPERGAGAVPPLPPIALVTLAGALYVAAGLILSTRNSPHAHLYLLALQYLVILPLVQSTLRPRGSGAKPMAAPSPVWFALLYAGIAVPFAWLLGQSIYSADESAYLFQAKTMLYGRLAADAPPLQDYYTGEYARFGLFFNHVMDGRNWFGKYPPGWPALLAAALWIKAGWLAAPLFGLVSLWAAIRIAKRFGSQTASLTAALLAISPYVIFNCVGYMSHALSSALIALAALAFFRSVETKRWINFALLFFFLGLASTVRPYSAACAAVVLGVAGVIALWDQKAVLLRFLAIGAAFAVLFGSVMGAYNKALTGSYWISTYAYYSSAMFPVELSIRMASLQHNLSTFTRFGVQETIFSGFPFVFLLAGYALWNDAERRFEKIVLAVVFLLPVIAHMAQTDQSYSRVGERYYFDAFFAAAILAGRGAVIFLQPHSRPHRALQATVGVLVAMSIFNFTLFSKAALEGVRPYLMVQNALDQVQLNDAVVFFKSSPGFKAQDLNLNPVEWRSAPAFYMPDPGPDLRSAVARSLRRSHWLTVTYRGGSGAVIDYPGK